MAIRNFYGKAYVDGRKTDVTFGPAAKDGGFSLDLYIRDKGTIKKAATVAGFVDDEGLLRLECNDTLLARGER